MVFDDQPVSIRDYHRRTKHASHRYAMGPSFLDWDNQPDPFRRFDGARQVALPLYPDLPVPTFSGLQDVPAQPLNAHSVGLFLELALGLSAWKEMQGSRWALRNNPSSGNLHPTEGWVILPPVADIGGAPALYHYAPLVHGLEERCRLSALPWDMPDGAFLLAFSSIPWRESWKYGERAFRYCQLDVGHALAAVAYAAACVGWHVRLLSRPGDDALTALLGLDRPEAQHGYETEYADVLLLISPQPMDEPEIPLSVGHPQWFGQANRLSADHDGWPVVDQAAALTHRPEGRASVRWQPESVQTPYPLSSQESAAQIIRRRRSAQRMKKGMGMGRGDFFALLAAVMPTWCMVPWAAFPWSPHVHLMLYVHQVEGLEPGLYTLIRSPDAMIRLQAAMQVPMLWQAVEECALPLYLLQRGEMRTTASGLSCLQAIAGHSAFSLGMLADFSRTLEEEGDWAYRRLHWEAGMIGHSLYLSATALGLSGTGIGCFFDDEVCSGWGLDGPSQQWQSLYHFTVGEAMVDDRLTTHPPYC